MAKIKDITGQIFGRYFVLEFLYIRNCVAFWKCQCSCGNIRIVNGSSLRQGKSKSCGCLQKELASKSKGRKRLLRLGEQKYNNYKKSSKERNYEFNLSLDDFINITQSNCYYCGEKPKNKHRDNYIYNGIDRINNNFGYILENCVPCCKICNISKNNMGLNVFKEWVYKVYHNLYK